MYLSPTPPIAGMSRGSATWKHFIVFEPRPAQALYQGGGDVGPRCFPSGRH